MKTLIVPMAGRSSRYPNLRPKWMLTHPGSGRFMAIESIMGMNLEFFDVISFVCLSDHEKKYNFTRGFEKELEENGLGDKSLIMHLDKQTASQSETVAVALEKLGTTGFVLIKDSDNFFNLEIEDAGNQVAFFDLEQSKKIDPGSKSYIQMDSNGILTNIVEKKVASSLFSVGGYGFEDASEFYNTFNKLSRLESYGEIYISHVIFEMILSGSMFKGVKVDQYKDWGTYEDWIDYIDRYKCIFVDIDGVLLTNTSPHFSNLGQGSPIEENISLLNSLRSKGQTTIILTTSRSENYRDLTEKELSEKGMGYDRLIMGLPHCQRIIINDFAESNPYPSCFAINLERNSATLNKYL
jgi:hypothetical protein